MFCFVISSWRKFFDKFVLNTTVHIFIHFLVVVVKPEIFYLFLSF